VGFDTLLAEWTGHENCRFHAANNVFVLVLTTCSPIFHNSLIAFDLQRNYKKIAVFARK